MQGVSEFAVKVSNNDHDVKKFGSGNLEGGDGSSRILVLFSRHPFVKSFAA